MEKVVLDHPTYVVGIGASAGGLDAIKEFFDHLPMNTHMSFIIIQHLSPNFKSLMNELLSKHTQMQILLAEDQMEIQPDHIYLNRNDKNIKIKDKKIHLLEKSPKHSLNLPIDLFFHSLGEEFGEKAIAIVLSGTGTDGSRGIKTIKEAGGTIMIQDPETAQFNGMPNMALNTDLGEIVASPGDLAEKILLLPQHADYSIQLNDDYHVRVFSEILNFIYKKCTIDFTLYKENTLIRRLKKRINILNYKNLSQYLDYLRKSPTEWENLYKDFLIGVTNFFRDPEAFDSLIKNVFPNLTANRNSADTIRIWVPGCSTGEEAYSLALALDLYLKQNRLYIDYKIFATDVDQQALLKASPGIFPVNVFTDIPEDYLNNYFIKVGDEFQIIKQIREKIIFSQHNLIKDPPFIRIDMISCRNLLIYIKADTQERLLRNFQFSLVHNGYLFLGNSENIGVLAREFEITDDHWRIFKNISEQKTSPATFSIEPKPVKGMKSIRGDSFARSLPKLDRNFFQEILTDLYSPSCLFFDSDYQVLYSQGDIRKYLSISDGVFSSNLMDMINRDLAAVIRNGVRRISKENTEVSFKGLSYQYQGESRVMNLKIQKPVVPTKQKTLYLLEFSIKEKVKNNGLVVTGKELGGIQDQRIEDLEAEIRRINEEKQNIVEDLETSNEELQASNEELMASNEELQSTNEELQSVNEELYTVNTELQSKNKELEDLTLDIDNLLVSTQIGTLFLDKNLKVRKFTPELKKVFHLEENDIGRSINDFVANFVDISSKEIIEAAEKVMKTRKPVFREIQSLEKKVYYKRITPYITKKKQVNGVVLTFIDITKIYETEAKLKQKNQEIASQNEEIMAQNEELKTSYDEIQRVNRELLESERRFKDIFEQAAQGIAYLGFNGQILMANDEFLRIFGYSKAQPAQLTMQGITHPDDLQLEMELFNDIFTGKSSHYSIEKRGIRKDGSEIWIKVTNSLSTRQNSADVNLISIVSDITDRKKAEARIKEARDMLEY